MPGHRGQNIRVGLTRYLGIPVIIAIILRTQTYRTRYWTLGVRNVLIVYFPRVLLQVEIATKSLLTNVTSVRLVIVVSVHVEGEIVNLK